ncbi:ATP-dependent endonuclease [Enterococcus faecalis]|uniref:ATP-dependent endonuclease n=1 Tax=Enterococcus faecalis TaxID=1351 RepID=UPI002FD7B1A3
MRVLRKVDSFECSLYDLRSFHNILAGTPELLDFYNYFYAISFPNIIFADKVILYEGDTERMLINSLLKDDQTPFPKLKSQYLSFVQVGGAYAVNYEPILKYLDIKSLIITDIDYGNECSTKNEIDVSKSTNDSINKLLNMKVKTENTKTIKEIYSYREANEPYVLIRDNICLTFQGDKDGYTRTLEEAMLCKLYSIKSFDMQTKDWWKNKRKSDNLKYSIPNNTSIGVRKIINSTSKNKTDFMYSVLLNNKLMDTLPYYIEEGLKWLEK